MLPLWLSVAFGSVPVLVVIITLALRIERRFNSLSDQIVRNRQETRRNRNITSALVKKIFPAEFETILAAASEEQQ